MLSLRIRQYLLKSAIQSRFASTTAGRLEKPPLRNHHRYEIQNSLILAISAALGTGYLLNTFFWLPRKERMNKFFSTYDDKKRTQELLEGGILEVAIEDYE